MNFRSDNTSPAAPEILDAIVRANAGKRPSYSDDDATRRVEAMFRDLFACDLDAHLVATGTAANALALAALTPPTGAVLCHREAHIETDECGAPEFFTGGAKLVLIDGAAAKIDPEGLREAIARNARGVHSVAPAVVSITQASERGAVYAPDEVAALADIAHAAGLALHMDGTRFANAVAHRHCHPAELANRAGVDVLSFGATKNGALAAEAIIVFDRTRAGNVERLRKRAGHLVSKHRYIAAQFEAYLDNDLWLRLASRANALAARIADAAGDWLSAPCQSNQVFIKPGAAILAKLRAAGGEFYDWGGDGAGEARLVVSWDQGEGDVDAFIAAMRAARAG
jgi:threonine aldolase